MLICNDIYKSLHPIAAGMMVPGAKFEAIIRKAALDSQHPAGLGRMEDWTAERPERFRNPV